MDANYIKDETLGTALFTISDIEVGQTQLLPLFICEVRIFNEYIKNLITFFVGKGLWGKKEVPLAVLFCYLLHP